MKQKRPRAPGKPEGARPDLVRMHATVFLGYFAISVLFFLRRLLQGHLLAHGDGVVYYYPLGAYWREVFWSGFIDWNPYDFLGYSLAGSMQPGTYYPMNLVYLLMAAPLAFNFSIILHYALAAFFMYLLCRTQVSHLWPAILGGAAFGFAGFLMAHRGHVAMMNTGIWLPLIIYCYQRFRTSSRLSWLFGGAVAFAMQVTAGYFAVVVYTCILLGLYAVLTEALHKHETGRIRGIGAAVSAAVSLAALGCLLSAPQFYSTSISFRNAWRGSFDYFFFAAGSYPPFEILNLAFPFLFGGGYGLPLLFPANVVEDGGFLGCLPLITAIVVAAAFSKKLAPVRVWTVIALLVTLAMFNRYTPAGKLFFLVPVYNLFRFQSRFVVGLDLALAMLFCLGLEEILLNRERVRYYFRKYVLVSLGFICIGLVVSSVRSALFSQHVFDEQGLAQYLSPRGLAFVESGLSLSSPTLYVPLVFLASLIGLVWLLPRMPSYGLRAGCLMAFLLMEQYSFSLYYDTNWPKITQTAAGSPAFNAGRNPGITFINGRLGHSRYFETTDMAYLSTVAVPNGDLNLAEHRATLNGIEPLMSEDVNRMFGYFPNGVSPFADRLASGNLLLSLSAVKFVIVPAGWGRRQVLDRAVNTTAAGAPPRLESIKLGAWQFSDSSPAPRGEFILTPRRNVALSVGGLMYANLPLEKNARYLVRLEARFAETPHPLPPGSFAALTVDFYGPGFDTEQAKLRLFSVDVDRAFRPFESVFETELSAPQFAQVRIFNTSGYTIRIKSVEVKKLMNGGLPVSEAAAQRIEANGGRPYKLAFDEGGFSVYENLNALPRVFCASGALGMESREEMLQALLAWQVNPARQVLFGARDLAGIKPSIGSGLGCGTPRITRFEPGMVDVDAGFVKRGVVVFSEAWDPRWHAYLDGVETPDYRVDYFAQGIVVKAGTRRVQFRYQPFKGNYALAGPPAFALLWVFLWRRERRIRDRAVTPSRRQPERPVSRQRG